MVYRGKPQTAKSREAMGRNSDGAEIEDRGKTQTEKSWDATGSHRDGAAIEDRITNSSKPD